MAIFSTLRSGLKPNNFKTIIQNQVRNGGHYTVPARPSRWVYDKFKDDVHFYFMLTAIPVGISILAINILVGPAELRPIPEGYQPREWEYHPNPITRIITKYFKTGMQENYEVHLHCAWECAKISEMGQLRAEVKRQMQIHGDYKGWYHRPDIARYSRMKREADTFNTSCQGTEFQG
eukprot:TRINITY_DN216_c0_g1_i3.p2 TRINITY_DN216_c0_g1~~TRINITY_DN216_c0_g1_i3.p2  ORF type:complete len:177 (-),score=45.74 TRINITY_DN216_c0_g1_i3:45-575(-)